MGAFDQHGATGAMKPGNDRWQVLLLVENELAEKSDFFPTEEEAREAAADLARRILWGEYEGGYEGVMDPYHSWEVTLEYVRREVAFRGGGTELTEGIIDLRRD